MTTPPGPEPDSTAPRPDPSAPAAETSPPPRRRRRWKLKVFLLSLFLLPVLFVGFYTAVMLNYSYSEGNRAGYLQKFSRKGWICKTYEGELAVTSVPGVAPTIWEFSVRDDEVARQLTDASGKRVVLFYEEHRGLPTRCFGATDYFVDSVVVSER
jgi:hypothetical protein